MAVPIDYTTYDFEFFETPQAFSRYLDKTLCPQGKLFEPCVGSGAIPRAIPANSYRVWAVNDLDPRHQAGSTLDAASDACWTGRDIDWTITNTPFTKAIPILDQALKHSKVGVAAHLRISIHEPSKTGVRRTWFADHKPNGVLFLPRFAFQRSKTTGNWSTDSVCTCWVIWVKDRPTATDQFIEYAPAWVLDALDDETHDYRHRMDAIMEARRFVA